MNKREAIDIINIVTGITIILGGIFVAFNYVDLGLLISLIGTLFKALEVVLKSGVR